MSSFFIGGGRDDGNGGMLRRLDAAMLLDYDPMRLVPSCLTNLTSR